MRNDHYPPGGTLKLLPTERVTPQTRAVLQQRLDQPQVTTPQFFTPPVYATLQAVCSRLILQEPGAAAVDLPGILDNQLAKKQGDGWRYDALPEDGVAHTLGLQGIEETAQLQHSQHFTDLNSEQQDALLAVVQKGNPEGETWKHLNAALFFEELLVNVTSAYYSHPIAKDDIGDASWADAGGWQHFGLNQTEAFEPPVI